MRDYDLFVSNATTNISQRIRNIILEFALYTNEKVVPTIENFYVWVGGTTMVVNILFCDALQWIFWLFL